MHIQFHTLPHFAGLELPSYASINASGMDLRAALPEGEAIACLPGQTALVPTGLCMAIPRGYEGQIRPRSGLALRHGLTCLNAPGTIDADYRGEVKILLINHGREKLELQRGMRVAQLVIAPVAHAEWTEVAQLPSTERDEQGFGSTGV